MLEYADTSKPPQANAAMSMLRMLFEMQLSWVQQQSVLCQKQPLKLQKRMKGYIGCLIGLHGCELGQVTCHRYVTGLRHLLTSLDLDASFSCSRPAASNRNPASRPSFQNPSRQDIFRSRGSNCFVLLNLSSSSQCERYEHCGPQKSPSIKQL